MKSKNLIRVLIGILVISLIVLLFFVIKFKSKKPVETETENENVVVETQTEVVIDNNHDGQAQSFLTGEWIDAELASKRPIALMVENTSACLPRYGISKADIIYECPVEGGSTRYMALFQDYSGMEKIGNVRSCRHYYVYFAHEYDAIYLHAGASNVADNGVLKENYIEDVDAITGRGEVYFYRDSSEHKAPHNLYTSSDGISKIFDDYGYSPKHDSTFSGNLNFADDTVISLDDGVDAAAISMCYPINKPWFVYDNEAGVYYRYQFKDKETDGIDNSQLSVKNIIIMNANVTVIDEPSGLLDIDQLSGGNGYFITNGKAVEITWARDSYNDRTHFFDKSGKEIILNQGKTWIEVCGNDSSSKNVIYSTLDEFNNR